MLNLRHLIFPIGATILLTATALTLFKLYKEEKPFYVRLSKKRKLYKLQNVGIIDSTIVGDLIQGKQKFTFNLRFLDDEIIQIQVNDPYYTRYVVKDVVKLPPKIEIGPLVLRSENRYLDIIYHDFNININCDDLNIDIYKNAHLFLSVNSEKLFVIEEKEPHVGIATDFLFPDACTAYGLPQHAERLRLEANDNKLYRLYNTDRFAYSTIHPQEPLYGSVPLIYAHGTKQTAGVLWLNSSDTYVNVSMDRKGLKSVFFSESGAVDFYILSGPSLQDVVRQNSELTGAVPLPPLFALGYHQCRFSYMTQEEVIEVSEKFDETDLPLDSLWMDIDYTDAKKYFTWNPTTYPNPEQLLKFIENKKRKAVVIIDPHIKIDQDYFVYTQCKKGDFLVKNPNGTTFTAKCWPGISTWIDFLDPKARQFYSNLHRNFVSSKILHVWNDMNEPALFEATDNAMPKSVLHHGDVKHRDVHNLYGFYQTMATYEGLLNRSDVRPLVLTRAHFAGSQRFATIWTGDNCASWDHLRISIPMCLTASLAGFSLCGADIGGFVKHPDDELLQRWYQLGAWLPFFRGHSNRNVPRREPYLYDKTIQNRIRFSLRQRYRHLFHWYTLFWVHYTTLQPVVRPLIYQYPHDENVLDMDNEFLVGEDILVCPVLESQTEFIDIYLPGGETECWYYIQNPEFQRYTGDEYFNLPVDLDAMPVFYRGGAIVPIVEHPVKCSADFLSWCCFTLYVFCDTTLSATGALYIDDTESFQYKHKQYTYIKFYLRNAKIYSQHFNRHVDHNPPAVIKSIQLYGYDRKVNHAALKINGTSKNDQEIHIFKENNYILIENLEISSQQDFILTLLK